MSGWLRRHAPLLALELAVNAALPFLIYGWAAPRVGAFDGVLVAAVPPLAWLVVLFAACRRLDAVSLLVLGGMALSLVAAVGGGSVRLLLLREKLVTGAIGVAFLVSAALDRPLVEALARAGARRGIGAAPVLLDAVRADPIFRRTMTVLTVAWGVGLLADVAVSVWLVFTLSARTYLLVNPLLGHGGLVALGGWTFWYARRRHARRLAARSTPPG